ncbi:MAG TPA: acylphosphatase [Alphaproteobacteria bacterium]|nr:acylphosphatase [Alphaproteobacteria bacterium]
MSESSRSKTVRIRIEGRVQGVWFRAWTGDEAMKRGVRGWVRNRKDGSVEAQFSGLASSVDDMVEVCKSGPPHAIVRGVIAAEAEDDGEPGFRTLPTV